MESSEPRPAAPTTTGRRPRWRVVFAAFAATAHGPGVHYIYGVFQAALLDARFSSSRALLGGAGGLSTCLMLLGARPAGTLQAAHGAGIVVGGGAAVAVVGLLICAAATELWMLYVGFGVLVGVGHALHTHAAAAEHMQLVDRAVRPHPRLLSEARRFVRAALDQSFAAADGDEGYGVRGRYVALHWRHGDYVDYNLVATADRVVRAAAGALDELGCADCAVFLMTNHPNATAVDELRTRLPALVRYGSGDDGSTSVDSAARAAARQPKSFVRRMANIAISRPRAAR